MRRAAMVTEPKKRPRKAKRRRKPPKEIIDYVVQIEGWDFSYVLVLYTARDALDACHEYRDVEMKGRLLRPTSLPTDQITIAFPSTNLLDERRKDLKPIW
jgi:hypothetical protein